jgi:hypothetical protein
MHVYRQNHLYLSWLQATDVLVHRGIYEAAKGIYEQFMPEIIDHLNTYGDRAKLQFTGHSLGGSLSLLVNLMLLTMKLVKPSTLRPVVTFGSPFVFCGGEAILDELGLDESHVHCVMMHRDIVPRAFSCNYPDHVAVLLKRLNGAFSTHPCLIKNVRSCTHLTNLKLKSVKFSNSVFLRLHVLCRNYCTLLWANYSFCNLMRRHLLRILYSLQGVLCMHWTRLTAGTLQMP